MKEIDFVIKNKGPYTNYVDKRGGSGVCQMSMLLHIAYVVNLSTDGRGGGKSLKSNLST